MTPHDLLDERVELRQDPPVCLSVAVPSREHELPAPLYGVAEEGRLLGLTICPEKAAVAGWELLGWFTDRRIIRLTQRCLERLPGTGTHVLVERIVLADELTRRTRPLVEIDLAEKHVVIVGTGASVHLIESLVRTGVGRLTLWDLDRVDMANVGRTGFDLEDVGLPKVRAVHRRLLRINPTVQVEEVFGDFLAADDATLDERLGRADLVVMGTDSQAVQVRGADHAYRLGRPVVLPGFYHRAAAGEIVVVVPPGPCYRCQVPGRFDEDPARSETDGHDLRAEPGLVFDCDHLDSIAGTLIVSLLAGSASEHLAPFARQVEQTGLILSKHHPTWKLDDDDLFTLTHGTDDVTFAYQTAWIDQRSARRPDCPICGNHLHSR
jgi:molybdopterin/thiamine biosynthesis adenylyltransferase